jgi:hypothetical protein
MNDDNCNNNYFDCQATDEVSKFQVEVEYIYTDKDDPDGMPHAATIHTHNHRVSRQVVAQTLVILAHNMLSEHLAHSTFEGCPSPALAHAMGEAAATPYLKEMIDNVPTGVDVHSIDVPDDVSELMEGD